MISWLRRREGFPELSFVLNSLFSRRTPLSSGFVSLAENKLGTWVSSWLLPKDDTLGYFSSIRLQLGSYPHVPSDEDKSGTWTSALALT